MIYTVNNFLFSHRSHRSLYNCFITTLKYTCDHLGSQAPELLLDLTERKFYWIPIWGVRYVKYPTYSQLFHQFLTFIRLMHAEVIHENAYFGISILFSELSQVLLKFRNIH